MAYKRIANWKIDAVAKKMTAHLAEQKTKIEKDMEAMLAKELRKNIPEEVLDFEKAYPNLVVKQEYIRFETENHNFYLYPKTPAFFKNAKKEFLKKDTPLVINLEFAAKEWEALRLKKNKLQNQIKCALSKLKSYKKIQDNFPEAYKVLIEEVDKEEIKDPSNLCDDVEKLRAELSSKK